MSETSKKKTAKKVTSPKADTEKERQLIAENAELREQIKTLEAEIRSLKGQRERAFSNSDLHDLPNAV